MSILVSILEQSLLSLPLVIGVYISYHILKITDVTVDGTFVLGAAVFARIMVITGSFSASVLCAVLVSGMAGVVLSMIQRRGKIEPLVSSILMLFMLYSINFQVMGKPNISLLNRDTYINSLYRENETLLWVLFAAIIGFTILFITVSLYSKIGLILRGMGHNKVLLDRLGKSLELYRTLGLAVANSLAGLCGALTAQVSGYADINMGFGMALVGIGSVVIGRQIVISMHVRPKFQIIKDMFSCLLGIMVYFTTVNVFLFLDINPINIKLFLGMILIVLIRSANSGKRII